MLAAFAVTENGEELQFRASRGHRGPFDLSILVGAEFPAPFLAQDPAHARYFIPSIRDQRYMFDLGGYVRDQLRALGLIAVELVGRDTCSEEDRFFSYRRATLRQEPDYGRQISLIGMPG